MSQVVRINDVGTIFELEIKNNDTVVDVSSASEKKILFQKPDGSILNKTAEFTTDGTDGKIQYTSIEGDLDLTGNWLIQAYVMIGASKWHSTKEAFRAEGILA